jgi:hypothetical protein
LQVKNACGTPTFQRQEDDNVVLARPNIMLNNNNKWSSPPDTDMLNFLVTLDKTKGLFFKLADKYV